MHTPFFPLDALNVILDMKFMIMSELQVLVPESIPILELMYFFEKANVRRKERIESAKKNEIYIG